jgi:hypothetical protein
MGNGVMTLDGIATGLVDAKHNFVANGRKVFSFNKMQPSIAGFLRIRDL